MGQTSNTREGARSNLRLTSVLAQQWRTMKRDLFESYRPERHYMRGPGPKWQAKHAFDHASHVRT